MFHMHVPNIYEWIVTKLKNFISLYRDHVRLYIYNLRLYIIQIQSYTIHDFLGFLGWIKIKDNLYSRTLYVCAWFMFLCDFSMYKSCIGVIFLCIGVTWPCIGMTLLCKLIHQFKIIQTGLSLSKLGKT